MRERWGRDSTPATVATTVVGLAAERRFADVEELFAPRLRAVASAETLRVGWEGEIARIGAVSAVGGPVSEPAKAGLVRVSVPVTGERGGLTVVMSVDDAGLLHGLRLAPPAGSAWEPPPYATPKRIAEHEVSVGAGALAVPGTMTLPKGRGPWPGLVLLNSGPFDRDLTTGPNKPFKDLAWGLASRGVAVVRFDKVTHTHPEVGSAPGFTMVEEYVPHALAAGQLLQQQQNVDAARVFVLGHSGGGKATPRVVA
ncbi:MAG TPA: hypothetical protein VGL02_31875, partial [Streptomyces sp.]